MRVSLTSINLEVDDGYVTLYIEAEVVFRQFVADEIEQSNALKMAYHTMQRILAHKLNLGDFE